MLKYALAFDKRQGKESSKGLALTRDVVALGLLKGDRVEPTAETPDVATVLAYDRFPAVIHLWRPASETLARHRNPLFLPELGTSPEAVMTIDSLHTVYLGVMKDLARDMAWLAMENGCFGGRFSTMQETLEVAALAIKHRLQLFYRARRQSGLHSQNLTEIGTM